MPFIASTGGTLGYGRAARLTAPASGQPYAQINIIATYLRGFMANFRNPSFYNYWCDGSGFFINDGGSDMYDSGNVTSPWLRSGTQYIGAGGYSAAAFPQAINYQTTTSTVVDTDFYYASLGYIAYNSGTGFQDPTYLPLTVIGARSSVGQPVGWQVGGNSGADGGGTLASGILYAGDTINGFTVHAFYRETYAAGDPSHCNLYILLGHPSWDSAFGTISSFADPVSGGGCGGYFFTSGAGVKNILAIQTLLSKAGGTLVSAAECQTVVQNFTLRIKEAVGF
jgi:hypothetical protein